jgi:hypothetical protein
MDKETSKRAIEGLVEKDRRVDKMTWEEDLKWTEA